jgi:malonyl-CoA O-methyltransferase
MPLLDAYALWAESYPPWPHNALMRAEQRVMVPLIAATTPSRALDVGTGTGRYLPHLEATGAALVIGLDLSMSMLSRHVGPSLRVCADAHRLPFDEGAFDLVTASLMVGDVERLADWVHEMARVLTPGGHLIYSDFHPAWAAEGWRRTFRTVDGRLVELDFWPHTIDDHLAALSGASLHVRTVREPRLGGRRSPVVVALHAIKRRVRQR